LLRHRLREVATDASGHALLLVLMLLLMGGLVLPPLLTASITSLESEERFELKAKTVHAAESGMDDAMWQIRYGDLESHFTSPAYDEYDFQTTWSYGLGETVNDTSVAVSLENVWVPLNVTVPNKTEARSIIETGRLVVSAHLPDAQTCQVQIAFTPDLGIWLSPGFGYVAGSSNLSDPTTQIHAGGQTLLWTFSPTALADLPGVTPGEPVQVSTITFQFTANQPGSSPAVIPWVTTSGVAGVSYAWDADSKVYRIVSTAGGSRVEAYNVKSELRKLGSTLAGDYRAIGNSLMLDVVPDSGGPRRDTLLAESQASISDIPADATVEVAYLYWSGWFDGGSMTPDDSAAFKIDGTQVYYDGTGTPQQGAQDLIADTTQVHNNAWGYSYSSFKDVTQLLRTFSAEGTGGHHPGNGTYTVGSVSGDLDDQLSYAGWSLVVIFSSPVTAGHQVYLFDDFLNSGQYNNLDYDQDGQPGGTLSGFIVPEPIAGETDAATLTAFVAEGDDYYDGDYVAINGTKLWDGTTVGSLDDVWNGQSLGMSADGVDVDTFNVTWASGLLQPGDTSAQIDIYTSQDIWSLVYIVLSFRSETSTGGAISYMLEP
jgi:hypothetical protein